jgi:pimeloyl-ACP methyl ester carboxylesterase
VSRLKFLSALGACALSLAGTTARAQEKLHAHVLVFVPAYEGSKLYDPLAVPKGDEAPCVWGSLDAIRSSALYFCLRMPNPLVARPMLSAGPIDVYGDFVSAVTSDDDETHFRGYTEGGDFFIFAYDWRQEIATGSAPQLGEALQRYARIHETRTGIPADETKFVIVTHSMGGLVARTFLSENPQFADRIEGMYLVGCPSLGSVKAIKTVVVGPGSLKENAVAFPESLLNLLPSTVDANVAKLTAIARPSLYELLPFDDPRWEVVNADGSRYRVAANDLLSVGPWTNYWPSPELEKRLFLDDWLKKRAATGRQKIDPADWAYCQDPEYKPLQRMLAQVRDWRLRMGSLGYTNTLLTRVGEDSRLHVVIGTGLKTPTGVITEGAHDASIARYTYAPDNDGDETVTGTSALDDLHPSASNVKLINRVTHGKLMSDPQFVRYLYTNLAREPMVPGRETISGGTVP